MGKVVKSAAVKHEGSNGSGDASQSCPSDILGMLSTIQRIESAVRASAIDLSLLMAERIVLSKIEMDPGVLNAIYAKALESAQGLEGALILVHPLDREAGTVDALVAGRGFAIAEDVSVGRGGCRISAHGQEVDASLQTLLSQFRQALMKGADVPT